MGTRAPRSSLSLTMDSTWRTFLSAALLVSGAVAQQLSAQNASAQSSRQQTYSLTMSMSMGDSMVPLAEIIALTRAAALDIPPPGISGQAVLANASNQLTLNTDSIALISCDTSSYAGNIGPLNVFAAAEQAVSRAVVWYSTQADWCDLEGEGYGYNWIYSMKSLNDTQMMLETLGSANQSQSGDNSVYVSIAPPENASSSSGGSSNAQQQQDNSPLGPSPGTAVAMIILYSITGIITALFLVIIVTGAIRAHRHPERYGPRNIIGRTRQSRARGLARAMLETIPIVKFGEREEPPKPTDVELGDGTVAGDVQSDSQGSDTHAQPHVATATGTESSAADQEPGTGRRSSVGGIAAAATGTRDAHDTDNQGCSICTEDFEIGQDQRVLPCDHRFHPDCIDPWLLNVSGTCPLCRIDLRPQTSNTEPELDEHGNPIFREGDAEGDESAMPPPLGQENRRSGMGRSVVMSLMGIRRPDRMTRDERVMALRRYRQQQATETARRRERPTSSATAAGGSAQDESGLRTRLRSAFRIRTSRTGQEGAAPTAAAEPATEAPAGDDQRR